MTKLTLVLLSIFALSACDQLCYKTTQDQTPVQNLTGQDVNIKVCKGMYGDARVALASNATDVQTVSLGSRRTSTVRGGPDPSPCRGVNNDSANLRISLPEESFNSVKLCFNEESRSHALVDVNSACPTGFKQQTSAANCAANESP